LTDIHIKRDHALGLVAARKLAFRWAEVAERKLDMECVYAEGRTSDVVSFTRSGVRGELKVTKDHFELNARLGLLLGVFRSRIETEIVENLDTLLAHEDPHGAFEQRAAKYLASRKHAPPADKAASGKKAVAARHATPKKPK